MDFWERVVQEQDRLRRTTLILAKYPVLKDYLTLRQRLIEFSVSEAQSLLEAERMGLKREDMINLLAAHIKAIK